MENLIKKAKEIFGTSKKCNLSTFLLPGGEILNSDKYFSQDPNAHLHDLITERIKKGLNTDSFMKKTGAIRYHPTKNNIGISIDVNHPITNKQMEFLEECSCFKKGKERPIIYDFYRMREGKEYSGIVGDGNSSIMAHDWTGRWDNCFEGVKILQEQSKRMYNKYGKEHEQKELQKQLDAHWEATAEERKRTHTGKIYDKYIKEKG